MNPNDMPGSAGDAQRLEAATEWMLRLRDDTASEQEIVRWVQWCEADPRNQQAFDRVRGFWQVSGALAQEVVNGDLVAATAGTRPAERSSAPQEAGRRPRARWSGYRRPLALAAANALVIFTLVAAASFLYVRRHSAGDDDLVAAASEAVHEAELSDGSKMELAAKSVVAVHYSEARRAIELREGEAYFTVAPNKERPFVVAAGNVRVRAVGTAFNVRQSGGRAVITVTKGKVDVYRIDPGVDDSATAGGSTRQQSHLIRVAAGEQVSWDEPGAQDPVVAAVDPAVALGWREGRLAYDNEPLGSVIADYNRYSRRQVVIDSDTVRNLRFSGTLLTGSTREWLRALPGEFPVQVRDHDGVDVIEPLPRQPS